MSSRELAAALFGVLGIWVLGASISSALALILAYRTNAATIAPLYPPFWSLILIAMRYGWDVTFGATLLLLRNRIAAHLFPEPSQPGAPIGVSDLQVALFSVVGLGLVISSLGTVTYGLVQSFSDRGIAALWPDSAQAIAEGVLGIALFLGARGLAGVWSLARRAGDPAR